MVGEQVGKDVELARLLINADDVDGMAFAEFGGERCVDFEFAGLVADQHALLVLARRNGFQLRTRQQFAITGIEEAWAGAAVGAEQKRGIACAQVVEIVSPAEG